MHAIATIADVIEHSLCPEIDALLCLYGATLRHQQKRTLERVESMLEALLVELTEQEEASR